MTQEQLNELARAKGRLGAAARAVKEAEEEVHRLKGQCDHVNPDGTSAVHCGPGWHSAICELCDRDNDYGDLDSHMVKYHGWDAQTLKKERSYDVF